MTKKLKLVFAPGAFDTFEGSQEELDSLIAEIQAAFDNGELMENSTPVDMESLIDTDPALAESIFNSLESVDTDSPRKNLQ
jgi:hypothetical protein